MKSIRLISILLVIFLSACNGVLNFGIENTPPPLATPVNSEATLPASSPLPTNTLPAPTATLAPSDTPQPTATNTLAPTVAPAQPTDTIAPLPSPSTPNYVDDRSTASQVIVSFYNAIDRHEYARAYDYWVDPSNSLGNFTTWSNGYTDTANVDLVFGSITAGMGAGQMYYTVPVILKTTKTNNSHANYAACYVVHLAQPANFGAPPFDPMGITQGQAASSALNASDSSVLATACSGMPMGSGAFPAGGTTLDISNSNYLDNRSGAIETVSSFLNALNLKQYVRAYYYFQTPSTFPGSYDPWAAGYANTGTISVTFGTPLSEGAAGSIYYKVPLATVVLTTTNTTQTFVGCYTLRFIQPGNQTVPPFTPLGIVGGKFTQVANGTNVSSMLPTACN